MTPIDIARLEFDLHAGLLQRDGRGGAPVDPTRAQAELEATETALQALALALIEQRVPKAAA